MNQKSDTEPLAKMLNRVPQQERSQILGEKLYPKVQALRPDLAGKITGMLLEMEVKDGLTILEDKDELEAKVEEALTLLEKTTKQKQPGVDDSVDEILKKELISKDNEISELKEKLTKYEDNFRKEDSWKRENKDRAAELIKENNVLQSRLGLLEKVVKITEQRLWAKEREIDQMVKEVYENVTNGDEVEDMETHETAIDIADIIKHRQSGFVRLSPHEKPEQKKRKQKIIYCETCGKQVMDQRLLASHETCHKSKVGSHACASCPLTFSNRKELDEHMKHHTDGDHTCQFCDLEFDTKQALDKHINIKHLKRSELNCNICGIQFQMKYQLREHIKEHKTHKPCRKFADNNCEFDRECRFNHIILSASQVICFECGSFFTDKTQLMKHIEEVHGSTPCNKFAEGKCTFGNKCIYKHDPTVHQAQQPNQIETNPKNSQTQDFQGNLPNTAPPNWPGLPKNQQNQQNQPNQPNQQNQLIQITSMMAMMEKNMTALNNMIRTISQ